MMTLVSIIVLGVLITVHELGHFLVAKFFRVGVLEFAIGFGKKLWSYNSGETTYSLRMIPLGGYVRMVGDDPHQLSAGSEKPVDSGDASMALQAVSSLTPAQAAMMQDRSRWFLGKSFIPKASIVLAGPMFNLIFGLAVAIGSFYAYGKAVPVDEPVIGDVLPGLPAEKAGLRADDRVLSVDGTAISSWKELAETIGASGGREIHLKIQRRDASGALVEEEKKISAAPQPPEIAILEGAPPKNQYKIGIMNDSRREPIGFVEAVEYGTMQIWIEIEMTVRGLFGMIRGAISPTNIAGPIYIFHEIARSATKGFQHLLDIVVLLSVSLVVLNLLPIPVLDGGHLVFFVIEAIIRRPVNIRIQEIANQCGMLLLLMLMIFAFGNDILRVIPG